MLSHFRGLVNCISSHPARRSISPFDKWRPIKSASWSRSKVSWRERLKWNQWSVWRPTPVTFVDRKPINRSPRRHSCHWSCVRVKIAWRTSRVDVCPFKLVDRSLLNFKRSKFRNTPIKSPWVTSHVRWPSGVEEQTHVCVNPVIISPSRAHSYRCYARVSDRWHKVFSRIRFSKLM